MGGGRGTSLELKGIGVGIPIKHHMIITQLRSTKHYMTSIYRKNITKDLTIIRTNPKKDKNLFRNGYLASLLELLKSIQSRMHLSGNLKLVNESHRSHTGATTSINNKLTHLTSNGTSNMEDLLHLTRFKGNLFGMVGSSDHQ